MATLNLTGGFSGQSSGPNVDWSPGGSSMVASLSPTDFTETAVLSATHTFSDDVVINSAAFSVGGVLAAGGITGATLYVNSSAIGAISSGFSFSGSTDFVDLIGRTLTVTIRVSCSQYSGNAPTLTVNYPSFTVDYTVIPALHNLGVNF